MRDRLWSEGHRNGVRWAVTWLHERAGDMNDPWARAVLNMTADHMGSDFKSGWLTEMRAFLAQREATRVIGGRSDEAAKSMTENDK